MRRLYTLICLLFVLPAALAAQSQSDEDRGFIQGLLEDALSSAGRQVFIEGFEGALSSRATIDRISVADGEGTWLVAEDLALTWRRTALLRGRIEIDEISIARIDMPRAPVTEAAPPSPEASGGFSLPELPVSVEIQDLDIARASFGEPVFGIASAFSIGGEARLADGEGNAALTIDRLDAGGEIRLIGSYSNESRALSLDLALAEPPGGIAATLLDLPDAPSVSLTVAGEGPIDDFVAEIALATDGQDRLGGTVELLTEPDGARRFRAALAGDVAPVVAPQYGEFLGSEVSLRAEGSRDGDGTLVLDTLAIGADALDVTGSAEIASDGWPQRFDLAARIAPPDGASVVLPGGGARTAIGGADLVARFDSAAGDAWTIEGRVDRLETSGVTLETLNLEGGGEIAEAESRVSGRVDVAAGGIDPGDPALARAIGPALEGRLEFAWQAGAPIRFPDLDIAGRDYRLDGRIEISDPAAQGPLIVRPDLRVVADDLSRFADLAGLDLTGATALALAGSAQPLTGAFDLSLDGTTRGLGTGIAQLDPLIGGEGQMRLDAVRDTAGLRVETARIRTPGAEIVASADVATGASVIEADLVIFETADILPGLSGRSEVSLDARQTGALWDIAAGARVPGAAEIGFDGQIIGDGRDRLAADGTLRADVTRLSAFSALAGRSLAGGATLSAEGRVDLLALTGEITARGTMQDLRVDIDQIDGLLPGRTSFDIAAAREADGVIRVERLEIVGPAITASARFASDLSLLFADVRLPQTARVLPGLDGASEFTLDADREGDLWRVRADGRFPGAAQLGFEGTIRGSVDTALDTQGTASLRVDRLSAYAPLVGRSLSGSAQIRAEIDGDLLSQTGAIDATGEVQALRIAVPAIEPLIRGTTRLALSAERARNGTIRIERLTLDGPGLEADASGSVTDADGAVDFRLRLPNLGAVVPQLPGAASVAGNATKSGATWRIDVSGDGPGGITLAVDGTASESFDRLDLDVNGRAPLTLIGAQLPEQVLEGQARFDLSVTGPPALSSLGGQVALDDVRAYSPALDIGLEGVSGAIGLSGGRAQVDLGGTLSTGGRVALSGPVTLSPPFPADLTAEFQNAVLRDPNLYETVANGRITISGPLTGGASIGGRVGLETVELRIPSFGPSFEVLEGLQHVQPPADVQRTLQFAGLTGQAQDRPLPSFPVDLVIDAPNRIFVRGRGLDAELGGRLRLTGSTNDLVPVGQFDLIRGRIDLLGRRVVLTDGAVSLRGSFDPFISFTASTEVEETEISIRIEGFASAPDLIVESNPDLPEDEVLSLFLFGRSIEEISALQAVQLAAAVRTLSGQGGLGLTGQLREGLGVDDLNIGTDDEGNVEARVGAYLSENIYTDVTVNSDGDSQINLNLDLTDNVTVRGRLGSDGDSGLGIFFERDY